jgi:hypothetical protein
LIIHFKKEDLQNPDNAVKLGLPVMEKYQILKLVADLAEKEFNRNWTRYSIMLYANIGLLVSLAMTMVINRFWTNVIPSAIGMTVSIAWLKINWLSYEHTRRWQEDMAELVKRDKALREWTKGEDLVRVPWCFSDSKAQLYINMVPYAFVVVWTTIFLFSLCVLVWNLWAN